MKITMKCGIGKLPVKGYMSKVFGEAKGNQVKKAEVKYSKEHDQKEHFINISK